MRLVLLALSLSIAAVPPLAYSQQRTLNLQLIGSLDVSDVGVGGNFGAGVSAYKNLAFTTARGESVAIIDISNPASPVLLGQTPPGITSESHRALRIGQQDVLVTFWSGRLRLFDIGDPAHPQLIGSLDLVFNRGWHFEVTRQGNRVLALMSCAGSEGVTSDYGHQPGTGDLVIADISDPTSPFVVGEWGVIDEPALGLEFYLSEQRGASNRDHGESVWASPDGRRAYYAYTDYGVMILDISDPSNPRLLGRVACEGDEEGNVFDVRTARDGNLLLRSSIVRWPFQTQLTSGVLIGARSAGEDRDTPAIYARAGHLLEGDVTLVGQGCPWDAYLNDPSGKIALIQEGGTCSHARKAVRAQEAGATGVLFYNAVHTGGFDDAHGTASTGGRLVLSDATVVPITIPVAMVGHNTGLCLAQTEDGGGILLATNCVKSPTLTIAATSSFTGYGRIDLFDIRNPAAPIKLSTITSPNTINLDYALTHRPAYGFDPTANHLEIVGNTIYSSWWGDGLRVFDISHPSSPREIGAWTAQDVPPGHPTLRAWEVVHHNGMVLLNGYAYGVYILQRVE